MGNCTPPPPKSRIGKWRVLASSLILGGGGGRGWGFAVPFYSVQDCSYKQEGGDDFIFSD